MTALPRTGGPALAAPLALLSALALVGFGVGARTFLRRDAS
jgi:hypothetical protein